MNLPMLIKLAGCRAGHTLGETASLVKEYGQRHISLAGEVLARSVKTAPLPFGCAREHRNNISPPARADIPAILEIEKRSQPEPWTEKSFLEEFDRLHSYLLVARLADKAADEGAPPPPPGGIVGYICFWCVADEIQILNIAVHPDFRRRAVGRTLLSHAIRTGCDKKAGVATLEVRWGATLRPADSTKLWDSRSSGERPATTVTKKSPRS